jgi:hypothetical protein
MATLGSTLIALTAAVVNVAAAYANPAPSRRSPTHREYAEAVRPARLALESCMHQRTSVVAVRFEIAAAGTVERVEALPRLRHGNRDNLGDVRRCLLIVSNVLRFPVNDEPMMFWTDLEGQDRTHGPMTSHGVPPSELWDLPASDSLYPIGVRYAFPL